jgi:hypothetical protein
MVRTVVENMSPLPTMEVVLPKLTTEEAKLTPAHAMTALDRAKAYGVFKRGGNDREASNNTKDTGCWYCGEDGHIKADCPVKNKADARRVRRHDLVL